MKKSRQGLAVKLLSLSVIVASLILFSGMGQQILAGDKQQEKTVFKAKQTPDKTVYWVLPGQRELSKQVFGTAEDPKMTGKQQMKMAEGPVKELLGDLPILVGVPEKGRVEKDGKLYTKMPTPFSNKGKIVSGEFEMTLHDMQSHDRPKGAGDKAKVNMEFTDPAGNEYTIDVKKVIQPPVPGYETDGGVLTDGYHHGSTGTGTPLMPQVYTYGAFWGVGNVKVNGEVTDKMKVIHAMTTETVRDKNYHLAHASELPLAKENTIAGQKHHTHLVVLPITVTKNGPKYEPVETAFSLPNGKMQPFLHVMYEQDQLVKAEFAGKQ